MSENKIMVREIQKQPKSTELFNFKGLVTRLFVGNKNETGLSTPGYEYDDPNEIDFSSKEAILRTCINTAIGRELCSTYFKPEYPDALFNIPGRSGMISRMKGKMIEKRDKALAIDVLRDTILCNFGQFMDLVRYHKDWYYHTITPNPMYLDKGFTRENLLKMMNRYNTNISISELKLEEALDIPSSVNTEEKLIYKLMTHPKDLMKKDSK